MVETTDGDGARRLSERMRRCAIVALSRAGKWREAQALLPPQPPRDVAAPRGTCRVEAERGEAGAHEEAGGEEAGGEEAGGEEEDEEVETLDTAMEGGSGHSAACLHNAVLHAMLKAGEWRRAQALLHQMRTDGPSPDETTDIYATMAEAAAHRAEARGERQQL